MCPSLQMEYSFLGHFDAGTFLKPTAKFGKPWNRCSALTMNSY